MPVIAVGGNHRVSGDLSRLNPDDNGFLPDIQMAETADQTHAVKLSGFFFKSSD